MARPEKSFKAGALEVAVWAREQTTDKGTQIRRGVSAQKRYYDKKSEEWKTTAFFGERDVGTLVALLLEAFGYIIAAPRKAFFTDPSADMVSSKPTAEKVSGPEGEEEIPF